MQIGMIGLGRMGGNIVRRLTRNGHQCVVFDRNPTAIKALIGERVATCLGFGPRFLHSTGQAYKGGPNTGVFLQITCDDAADLQVPDQKYTFGVVKAAEARGDFEVLAERDRRVLRVHLGSHVAAGLASLKEAVRQALV